MPTGDEAPDEPEFRDLSMPDLIGIDDLPPVKRQFIDRTVRDPELTRLGIEREFQKTWIYAGLAALALILSAIVMIVGVGLDPQGASLSVTDWAKYRGGPSGVFILASMWFAYLGRSKVHIGK